MGGDSNDGAKFVGSHEAAAGAAQPPEPTQPPGNDNYGTGDNDDDAARTAAAILDLHIAGQAKHKPGPGPRFTGPAPTPPTPSSGRYSAVEPDQLARSLQAVAAQEKLRKGTKVDALAKLARQGFPSIDTNRDAYDALARSIAPDLHPGATLRDFAKLGESPDAFGQTATGQSLKFHDYAFAGSDCICTAVPVTVEGKRAAWIYSEFDTDSTFETCLNWMHPAEWPVNSSLLFKGMLKADGTEAAVADVEPVRGTAVGDVAWYAQYLEVVQLFERVRTQLRFDHQQRDKYAAMSYVLDPAPPSPDKSDRKITVDRGFLSVNDLGPVRHVKVLKIVGFTEDRFTDEALTVCPWWTDFVKGAVEGSTIAYCAQDLDDSVDQYADFANHAFAENLELGTAWARASVQRDYSVEDLVNDSAAVWLKLAKDWTEAWGHGLAVAESLAARSDLVAGDTASLARNLRAAVVPEVASISGSVRPSGRDHVETISIPITGLTNTTVGSISDLVRADDGQTNTTIPASAIAIAIRTVRPRGGETRSELTLRVDTLDHLPGLYCADYTFTGTDGSPHRVPVHFYVSRAVRAS